MISLENIIKRANKFLSFMYPPSTTGLEHGSYQQRDLVRTFFAGVIEGLIATEQSEAVKALLPHCEPMTEAYWFPDDRFYPHPNHLQENFAQLN